MKKTTESSYEMRQRRQKQVNPDEMKEVKLIDIGSYKFLCGLQPGRHYSIMGKPLLCHSLKPLLSATIEYAGCRFVKFFPFN